MHDYILFGLGIAVGGNLMALFSICLDLRDARRSNAQARAAFKRGAGDRYLSSLRLYQLQQRSTR